MRTTPPPYQRRLTFEIRLLQADEALGALAEALRGSAEEVALREAIYTRRAIGAVYRAWDALDEPRRNLATMIDLRRRGHEVLSQCLHDEKNEKLVRSVLSGLHAGVVDEASNLALLAVLWKIANVLDEVQDADAA